MNKKIRIIIITTILILSALLINQLKYRNDKLYAVNLKNKIDKDLVSILVNAGSNNYTNYEGNTFPSNTEYTYNSELSKCQDNNGNVIEGILSYNEATNMINVKTTKTTYCYLYFDKILGVEIIGNIAQGLIENNTLWQSGLEGDGYRYIGSGNVTASTSPNNFICFGTNSLEECKANKEKYMYRIIGVFPDELGEQHLKLIKYKQLPETYSWHSDNQANVSWEESDLYKGLNGISGGSYNNLFMGNTIYDYLQDNIWLNKIVDWKWTATNTLRKSSGPYYSSITTEQMYLHEMNRSTKTNTVGEWTYPIAKIGLMYASDYQMSLGSSSLTMMGFSNASTLKTGWLYKSNSDTTDSSSEWTLSSYGVGDGRFFAWRVYGGGFVYNDYVNYMDGVRPVFYLDSNIETLGGTGSYNNPYLISDNINTYTYKKYALNNNITLGDSKKIYVCEVSSSSDYCQYASNMYSSVSYDNEKSKFTLETPVAELVECYLGVDEFYGNRPHGYYIEYENNVYFVNNDATVYSENIGGKYKLYIDGVRSPVLESSTKGDFIEEVTSYSRSEYPSSGIKGNYWYELVE